MPPDKNHRLAHLARRVHQCTKCALALTRTQALPGAGDTNARLMIVAQAPGDQEDRTGHLFIGPSGQVFDQFLEHAGLSRQSLFVTNLLKCRLPKCRRPKQREITACLPYLQEEMAIVAPDILVPLGFYAMRSVMHLSALQPPQARADSPQFFGRLYWQGSFKIYPLPHPASLLYNPAYRPRAQEMYATLGILARPCRWYSLCPMKRFFEAGHVDRRWIELYCTGDWSRCVRFQQEEQGIPHPDWMLPDGSLDQDLKALS